MAVFGPFKSVLVNSRGNCLHDKSRRSCSVRQLERLPGIPDGSEIVTASPTRARSAGSLQQRSEVMLARRFQELGQKAKASNMARIGRVSGEQSVKCDDMDACVSCTCRGSVRGLTVIVHGHQHSSFTLLGNQLMLLLLLQEFWEFFLQ